MLKKTVRTALSMTYLASVEQFPQQLREALELSRDIRLTPKPHLLVLCVDSDASSVGEVVQSLGCSIPVFTNTSDVLPAFVNHDTLVICVSYSGMALEVVHCAHAAVKMKTRLMIITSGGKLLAFAQAQNVVRFQLPAGHIENSGLVLMPVVMLLARNNCVLLSKEEVKQGIQALAQTQMREKASEIARQIGERTPCVYAGSQLAASTVCIKESLSRVAKILAHANTFPAMARKDAMVKHGKAYVLLLRDECESQLVQAMLDQYKNNMQERKIPCTEVMLRGKKKWNKLIIAMMLGEYLAYFLAERLGVERKK